MIKNNENEKRKRRKWNLIHYSGVKGEHWDLGIEFSCGNIFVLLETWTCRWLVLVGSPKSLSVDLPATAGYYSWTSRKKLSKSHEMLKFREIVENERENLGFYCIVIRKIFGLIYNLIMKFMEYLFLFDRCWVYIGQRDLI